jgi:hypothetical protein
MLLVRYRYDANDEWVYVPGDRWECEQVDEICYGGDITPYVEFDLVIDTFGFGNQNENRIIAGEPGTKFIDYSIATGALITRFRRADGSIQARSDNPNASGVFISVTFLGVKFYLFAGNFYSFSELSAVVNDENNGCYPAGFEFRVYSDNQLTHSEIRDGCPMAELAEGCPPDTCEVVCGDTMCCYNSQGISVSNFLIV